MSIAFSLEEIIKLAVGIEKQGIVFYDVMARSTQQPEARDLFKHLAEAERHHMTTFSNMLPQAAKSAPSVVSEGEYDDYLKALVNNAVFTDEMATNELATRTDSDVDALDIGINAEKDSILFYYYMRDVVPQSVLPAVNKIIGEEKEHLSQLSAIKTRLSAGKSK